MTNFGTRNTGNLASGTLEELFLRTPTPHSFQVLPYLSVAQQDLTNRLKEGISKLTTTLSALILAVKMQDCTRNTADISSMTGAGKASLLVLAMAMYIYVQLERISARKSNISH